MSRAQKRTRSRNANVHRHHRVIGPCTAPVVLVTFGATAQATAPPARADLRDWVLDVLDPGSWLLGPDPGEALPLDVNWSAAADPAGTAAMINQFLYDPIHSGIESRIDSDLGRLVDGAVNDLAGGTPSATVPRRSRHRRGSDRWRRRDQRRCRHSGRWWHRRRAGRRSRDRQRSDRW